MSYADIDREEARCAREAAEREGDIGTCYRHDYYANRQGGGTCIVCGATVSAEEIA